MTCLAALSALLITVQPITATAQESKPKMAATDDPSGKSGKKEALPDLVARLLPAVVSIATTQGGTRSKRSMKAPQGSPFNEYFREYFNQRRGKRRGAAVGSGFIIDSSGYVVTNNHVVARATEVKVILNNGRKLDAKIVGRDPRADLALLKVVSKEKLPTVKWGDSAKSRIGEDVVAIGNPFGLAQTVTTGIISARGRHLRNFGGFPGSSFVDFLQTDAAINKGNSGGPLFNRKGEVIGINTAIYSRGGTNAGIAFSIPSNVAIPILKQLREFGRTKRGWLGVQIQNVSPDLAKSLGLKTATGALVANVVPDSPAAKGGVLAGDVIIRFNGVKVPSSTLLPRIVAGTTVGKQVDVVVLRKRKRVTIKVTLGELEKAIKTGAATKTNKTGGNQFGELGLTLFAINPELTKKYKLKVTKGVVVTAVAPGSSAQEKGIRPGDVILEMDQTAVAGPKDIATLLKKAKEARKSSGLFLVQRGGNRRFVVIKLTPSR